MWREVSVVVSTASFSGSERDIPVNLRSWKLPLLLSQVILFPLMRPVWTYLSLFSRLLYRSHLRNCAVRATVLLGSSFSSNGDVCHDINLSEVLRGKIQNDRLNLVHICISSIVILPSFTVFSRGGALMLTFLAVLVRLPLKNKNVLYLTFMVLHTPEDSRTDHVKCIVSQLQLAS